MNNPAKRPEQRPGLEVRSVSLRQRSYDVALLVGLVVLAALVRLDFMRAGDFVIDSDEAIVGLMARHILEGRGIPTFYYGQHYMGSLEAICAAGLFWLFGSSPFTLQLTPLLFSLALVVVMYRLGCEVGGALVGRVAALLTALPPVALVVWSFKARGGFIELLVIAALAMLFTLKWLKREPSDARYGVYTWVLLGLGWWVNNQIIYFVGPIALCGSIHVAGLYVRSRLTLPQVMKLCGWCAVAFFLGSSPYWVYNIRHGFASLGMFGFASADQFVNYVQGLWVTAIPILLGAKRFWESDATLNSPTLVAYVFYGCVVVAVLASRGRSVVRLLRGEVDCASQVEIFFLVIIFACAVFTASTYGWLSQAPRYLLPLYIPLFVLCGLFIKLLVPVSRALASGVLMALVMGNVASCYWGGRALPGEPFVFKGERVSRDHREVITALDQMGLTKIRTNYWIGYRLAFETDERVTFLVLQEPGQVRLPEYQHLPAGATQDEVPLLIVPGEREIFIGALNRLGYGYQEKNVGGYVLIFDIKRPRMDRVEVDLKARAQVSASGSRDPRAAIDGSIESRWATGAPQQPGQVFEVNFREPTVISSLRYQLGEWSQDYPRGLRIFAEDSDGAKREILSPMDYLKLAIFFKGSDFEFWFQPRTVKRIIFEESGSHPILDWSIAELSVYAGDVAIQDGKGGQGQ